MPRTPNDTCPECNGTGEIIATYYTRDILDGLPITIEAEEPCSCLYGERYAAGATADIDAEFPPSEGLPF